MQVIIQFLLEKIADEFSYGRTVRSHIFGTQFGFCLAFKHRFFYLNADSRYDTRTDVGIFEVLIVILLDDAPDSLFERGEVRTALRGMLSVHKRIIFLAILVAMCNDDFDVFARQMDDGVKRFGRHIFVEQIDQTMAGIELFPVI